MWGIGEIEGVRVAIAIFDFRFMGGSMGSVVGEKIARCFETALAERIPAIVVSASGGARMQEGTLSLMQLSKTTAPLVRLDESGVPFIAVLTDPTTGGVLASFASLGDVILAEPKALIGFAGARVASDTVGEELPEGFQTAEFLLAHGFVDAVVPRPELRASLGRLLRLLPVPVAAEAAPDDAERAWGPIGALSGLAERLGGAVSETIGIDVEAEPGGNGRASRVGCRTRGGGRRRGGTAPVNETSVRTDAPSPEAIEVGVAARPARAAPAAAPDPRPDPAHLRPGSSSSTAIGPSATIPRSSADRRCSRGAR